MKVKKYFNIINTLEKEKNISHLITYVENNKSSKDIEFNKHIQNNFHNDGNLNNQTILNNSKIKI